MITKILTMDHQKLMVIVTVIVNSKNHAQLEYFKSEALPG